MAVYSIGIVGARGHVGAELINLIAAHPHLRLEFVGSRERAGQRVAAHVPTFPGDLAYSDLTPDGAAQLGAEIVVLALPNGMAHRYVEAFDAASPATLLVDLSGDYRFDPTWFYGLPELYRRHYVGQRRISNPGCYATAMQLAIAPMRDVLAGPVQCFGVSGYSGAGTTPSDKNDPAKLHDNLMPYALTDHLHEREATRHLQTAVEFMPHVAAFFRGLSITANLHLTRRFTLDEVTARYADAYAGEALVELAPAPPWLSHAAHAHGVSIGGLTLTAAGDRLVVVAALDNLLKGAATQALQNINLALGLDELGGIPRSPPASAGLAQFRSASGAAPSPGANPRSGGPA